MQPFGQVKMQNLQPLHLSELISIFPFLTLVCISLILNSKGIISQIIEFFNTTYLIFLLYLNMHLFVEIAKKTVEEFIKKGKIPPIPKDIPEEMRKKAGVFVSIKKRGQLRGCIGTFMPTMENIYEEIVRNAIAAATEDPRFPPVHEKELDELEYSVDILSPPEPVKSLDELDPKKYGVIVVKGWQRALLLPDIEGVNTVDEQLRITKLKAGIDPHDSDVEIYKFKVQRYK